METATPQDRLDAIQARLTTISGIAAELAAQASENLAAQVAVATSVEGALRQDLEALVEAVEQVLEAVEKLGPQGELLLVPALEDVAAALRNLGTTLRQVRP